MFAFQQPAWFALVPIVLAYAVWSWRDARRRASLTTPGITLIHPHLEPVIDTARGSLHEAHGAGWTYAAWFFFIVALAQPQSVGDWIPQAPQGRDMVLLLDTSLTMDIADFKLQERPVTRLNVLKNIMSAFVMARRDDRFGVVVFGSTASTLVPPTFDRTLVTTALARVEAGIVGQNTAIGDALGLALKAVDTRTRARPALILVTDGDSNAGELRPMEAIALAQHLAVPVYTIQIGGDDAPLTNNPAAEPTLRDIAERTGGHYYTAASTTALKDVVRDIDALEKTVSRPATQRASTPLYLVPLLIAVVLLLIAHIAQLRSAT